MPGGCAWGEPKARGVSWPKLSVALKFKMLPTLHTCQPSANGGRTRCGCKARRSMRLYNLNGLEVVQRTGQEREASPDSISLDELDLALIPYLHVSASIQMLNWPAIDR